MAFKLRQEAERLNASGLNVLPAVKAEKRPVGSWKEFRARRRAVDSAFDRCDALAVVCGAVSGNVEVIDFDAQAVDFDDWAQRVAELDPNAAQTLFSCVLETTQSGGKHLAYRCKTAIDGNRKLTTRTVDGAVKTTVETRGEGGIVIIAPTDGYRVIRGDWGALPVISAATRKTFLDAARSLSEPVEKPTQPATDAPRSTFSGDSIADDLRTNGELQRRLTAHGWRYVETRGSNEYWRRPGKTDGVSATLNLEKLCLYVFTSSAAPLEPNRAYSALQAIAALDFGGDEKTAARHYLDKRDAAQPLATVDFIVEPTRKRETQEKEKSEVVFPQELLRCGGLLEDLMNYTESQEYKPQPTLRFAGALALMSYLTARKISTFGSTRTNLYVVGLAESGGGKEAARLSNSKILTACGAPAFPEQYKSASALWKTIRLHGAVFSQIDEYGLYLKAVNSDTSHLKALTGAMLRAFSLSSHEKIVVDVGVTDHKDDAEPFVYPSFTFYGTTTYTDFVDAMTEKQLSNGFSSRCTFLAGDRDAPRNYRDYEGYVAPSPSESLIKQCRDWLNYRSTFAVEVPTAFDVPRTSAANEILLDNEMRAEQAQQGATEVERAFFSRVAEKTKKYALIFAASKFGPNEETLKIDETCARQAVALSEYEVAFFQRLLDEEIATSASEAIVKKVKKWIKTLEDKYFTKSEFTRKFQRLSASERNEALQTLIDLDVIEKTVVKTGKTNKTLYVITD